MDTEKTFKSGETCIETDLRGGHLLALSFAERKTEFLIRNVIILDLVLNFIFRFNRFCLFSFVIYTCL